MGWFGKWPDRVIHSSTAPLVQSGIYGLVFPTWRAGKYRGIPNGT